MYLYLCLFKSKVMILTIDIGNTRVKYAVFETNTSIEVDAFLVQNLENAIQNILNKHNKIGVIVCASVGNIENEGLSFVSNTILIHYITRDKAFPFQNKYITPQTLGIDRMVLAAGASLRFPKLNKLVIDAGTCITYDFIDENNVYHGGAISPGIRLRYESMHNFTANLPLLTVEQPETIIGTTTNQSLHSGVVNGLKFEIEGYIQVLKSQNKKFIIILTGGDAIFLANQLKNTIFANSNFLLESLNILYQYQIKND